MTVQVRKGVFETNSSSSHSLTMSSADVVVAPFPKEVLRAGKLELIVGEYGWEWYRYYSPQNKAAYLMTQIFEDTDGRSTEALRETYPEFDMLCRVIERRTGVQVVVLASSGYVEHQSVGNGRELFQNEDELLAFLFSPDSYIETGNDNSSPPKEIRTDKEKLDHYYTKSYGQVANGSVSIKVHLKGWRANKPHTPEGTPLEKTSELWQAILREGVVTKASWLEREGGYSNFSHQNPIDFTMNSLSGGLGLKFVESLDVEVKTITAPAEELLVLTVQVSSELAAAYLEVR